MEALVSASSGAEEKLLPLLKSTFAGTKRSYCVCRVLKNPGLRLASMIMPTFLIFMYRRSGTRALPGTRSLTCTRSSGRPLLNRKFLDNPLCFVRPKIGGFFDFRDHFQASPRGFGFLCADAESGLDLRVMLDSWLAPFASRWFTREGRVCLRRLSWMFFKKSGIKY